MTTLVVFLISLALIVFSLVMKDIEIAKGRKIFFPSLFVKCDYLILGILEILRKWWAEINLKNFKLIFSKIIVSIRKLAILIKRRFDHKQSHFFTKRDHDLSKNKGSVSFFLKDISEHKKALRENREEKE